MEDATPGPRDDDLAESEHTAVLVRADEVIR